MLDKDTMRIKQLERELDISYEACNYWMRKCEDLEEKLHDSFHSVAKAYKELSDIDKGKEYMPSEYDMGE